MTGASNEHTRDPLIRAFGAVLRSYREAAGLSRHQVAEALGCTDGWIEKMETGTKPSLASAIDLDTFFEIPQKIFQEMAQEIERAGIRIAPPPPGFQRYAELESRAALIQKFEALAVTGLLQTPDYAREVLKTVQRQPETIEQFLTARIQRQEILTRETPAQLFVTQDERSLRTMLGSREVMQEQLKHLLETAQRGNVTLQVVPASTGGYAGIEGSLTLLDFDGAPNVAYVEAQGQGQVIETPARVVDCAVRYRLINSYALPLDESLRLIESILESL